MTFKRFTQVLCLATLIAPATFLSGCGEISFAQKASPANSFKDYRAENDGQASVLGIGEPISTRQMKANATFTLKGSYTVEDVLQQMATTYNVAIRWGNGVRKGKKTDIVINNLSFDEARSYVEDTYDIQIIREGDRRLLVLPSASEPRVQSFKPGENVTLAQALRGLADQCGYNLVITENKSKIANTRITTNLRDVTCYDAFEALLNPQGLSLVQQGDYFTIGGMPQRQWNVGLDEPVRAEEVEVTYTSNFTSNSDNSSSSSSSGSSSGSTGSSSGDQSAGGTNKVTVKSERDLWKELQDNLQALIDNHCPDHDADSTQAANGKAGDSALLPPPTTMNSTPQNQAVGGSGSSDASNGDTSGTANGGACGYVRINRAVGLVQMRAPKEVLDEADDIIGRVEDIASRRLFLEARVLAVTRNRGYEQGATLSLGKGQVYAGYTPSNASITETLVNKLLSVQQGGGFAAVKTESIDAALRMLENYGTTYELMHPQLELMDRQRATLIDGTNQQYFIPEPETDTTTTGTVTNVRFDQHSQFVGLQFTASAQISNGDEPHTVSIQIPIVSVDKTVTLKQTINNQDYSTDIPVASTRLIDEKVRIRDGEIKAIGGLTKTIAIDKEAGQPLLRDIPAVGKLMNDENISYEQVEFVVLLQVRRMT
jgi:hypothetical protein